MVEKKAKPTYGLEEMLKVRERSKDTAEVVRKISDSECGDHILRSTNSQSVRSRRPRNSSIVTNPWDKEEVVLRGGNQRVRSGKHSKYSPTPSMKRGKAERLLKEHGSPPGIRVTAGGRIVPDGLSPLASPRFDHDGHLKPDGANTALSYGAPSGTSLAPYQGWVINMGDGNVGQIVDGYVRPVDQRNGSLHLYMPAPNLPPQQLPFYPYGAPPFPPAMYPHPPTVSIPTKAGPSPPTGQEQVPSPRELRLMEAFHAKLEADLKELNRNEVLQRGNLNARKKEEIVKARIALTEHIDENRRNLAKAKKLLKTGQTGPEQPGPAINRAALSHPSNMPPGYPFMPMHPDFHNSFEQAQSHGADPNVFLQRQATTERREFHPQLPEFVPRHLSSQVETPSAAPPNEALQERNSNVGRGSLKSSTNGRASNDTMKASTHEGMGLDGSVHHSRRSHAITIKDPNDRTVKPASSLNPASPSYQPNKTASSALDGTDHTDMLNFMPSPTIIAQMESLVQSPRETERQIDESAGSHQKSETSVNTVDFFPNSTHEYSSKYNGTIREHGRSMANWMPKEGDPEPANTHSTPIRPPNKFIYNNDSPGDGYWSNSTDPVKYTHDDLPQHPQSLESSDSPGRRLHVRESTVATDDNRYGRGERGNMSTPQLLHEVSERATHFNPTPSQGQSSGPAYRDGFDTGFRQDVMGDSKDEDFRRGYRDGLMKSMQRPSQSASGLKNVAVPERASQSLRIDIAKVNDEFGMVSPAQTTGVRRSTGPMSPTPEAPANSLATTPTHPRSARKQRSFGSERSLDSPSARADFEAQPNISIAAGRNSGTQTTGSLRSKPHSSSPSARRMSQLSPSEQSYMAVKVRELGDGYDQQRCVKGSSSVFQNNEQAHGSFRSQYDGSGPDGRPLEMDPMVTAPNSPSAISDGRTKPTGSPVRRRASAAVATMKQVAGLSGRKEESPARPELKGDQGLATGSNPPSPDKRAWRGKWTKNFRQVKKDDQTEEGQKREHPLR